MRIDINGTVWAGGNNDAFQLRTFGKGRWTDTDVSGCDGNTGHVTTIFKSTGADSRDVVWNIDVDQTSGGECIHSYNFDAVRYANTGQILTAKERP